MNVSVSQKAYSTDGLHVHAHFTPLWRTVKFLTNFIGSSGLIWVLPRVDLNTEADLTWVLPRVDLGTHRP